MKFYSLLHLLRIIYVCHKYFKVQKIANESLDYYSGVSLAESERVVFAGRYIRWFPYIDSGFDSPSGRFFFEGRALFFQNLIRLR